MPWSALLHTKFHVYGATQDSTRLTRVFAYGTLTLFGVAFNPLQLTSASHVVVLQPRRDKSQRFGLFRFRSPLLTESILFLFLRILRCFTSPRVALPILFYSDGSNRTLLRLGFPIRISSGIMRVCRSPKLFAACRVLHRHIAPRHPLMAVTGFMQTSVF
jgi:hypothetical protein